MEMIEYVKLVTAFIVSIGGSSVVIIALSKWFGNFLSTRLLDAGKSSVSCPLKPSDSTPLKHSTMPP